MPKQVAVEAVHDLAREMEAEINRLRDRMKAMADAADRAGFYFFEHVDGTFTLNSK